LNAWPCRDAGCCRPFALGQASIGFEYGCIVQFFKVKNWHDLQHYRDRVPIWIKLYVELLEDWRFISLSDATKWHVVGVWLLASKCRNRIPMDAEFIRGRIGAKTKVDLQALLDAEFIEVLAEVENHASKPLAECYGNATVEEEEEKEKDKEQEETHSPLPPNGGREGDKAAYPSTPTDEQIYNAYPRHVGKADALKKIAAAVKTVAAREAEPRAWLMERVIIFAESAAGQRGKYTPHPSTWFHQGRYDDDDAEWNKIDQPDEEWKHANAPNTIREGLTLDGI